MENLTNHTIANNYLLKEKKPSGQISDVYRAFDIRRGVDVAVKILRRDFADNKEFLEYFTVEAELMSSLEHPNIVRFFHFLRESDFVFIVMEWVEGSNLKDIIHQRSKPFQLTELHRILEPICSALNYAHLEGIIHCDIKPTNILMDVNGRVLLSDFGIARRVSQQTTGGTPPYMAPEQFTGKAITARTDVYALGVTCYELLSGGKVPFRGETSQTQGTSLRERIFWEVMHLPYPPLSQFNPSVSNEVDAVIRQALNRNPHQRQTSPLEFLNQLNLLSEDNSSSSGNQNVITLLPGGKEIISRESIHHNINRGGSSVRGAYLVGISGEWKGRRIPITDMKFTIGRHSNSLLHFSDPGVSRDHATILAVRDGFYLRDENSTAGTLLNGNPISRPQKLHPGDVIQIGKWHTLKFSLGGKR